MSAYVPVYSIDFHSFDAFVSCALWMYCGDGFIQKAKMDPFGKELVMCWCVRVSFTICHIYPVPQFFFHESARVRAKSWLDVESVIHFLSLYSSSYCSQLVFFSFFRFLVAISLIYKCVERNVNDAKMEIIYYTDTHAHTSTYTYIVHNSWMQFNVYEDYINNLSTMSFLYALLPIIVLWMYVSECECVGAFVIHNWKKMMRMQDTTHKKTESDCQLCELYGNRRIASKHRENERNMPKERRNNRAKMESNGVGTLFAAEIKI